MQCYETKELRKSHDTFDVQVVKKKEKQEFCMKGAK